MYHCLQIARMRIRMSVLPSCHNRSLSSFPILPPNSSLTSWLHSFRSSVQHGRFRSALSSYSLISSTGHCPDNFAIAAALKACTRTLNRPLGFSIHAQIFKCGHVADVYAASALVDLYGRLDGIGTARKVFDELPSRNVVCWNSILSAHLKAGEVEGARRLFDQMPGRDIVSWNSMVSGYAKVGDVGRANALFEEMPEKNAASWNGMITGFAESGDMASARRFFDRMPERSCVSWVTMISGYSRVGDCASARLLFDQIEEQDLSIWNAIIACYSQNCRPREALELFNKMCKMSVYGQLQPDEMTFSCVISACSQLGNLRYGIWVDRYLSHLGIELDDHLKTALIDLYAKSGFIDRASEFFSSLKKRDVVSYSAMILGCGINGRTAEATQLFEEMLAAGIAPNAITFMGLLTAYSHAGLVEEAHRCFSSMWRNHRIAPSADHYAIMVDLLGRVGRLDEAYGLIRSMPMKPHVGAWGALLLACRVHGNVELGEIAASSCFELEPESTGYYILLASIYAEAGKFNEAKRLRNLMLEKGLSMEPGCSWVERSQ